MKWISVKDELPTKGEFIALIGCKKFNGMFLNKFQGAIVQDTDMYIYFKQSIGWLKPSHFADVTHWMPLPEMPNEMD